MTPDENPAPGPLPGPPLGPPVDPTPRPLPARIPHRGRHVDLEPLHARHVRDLWIAAQATGGDATFTYLYGGPYPTEEALRAYLLDLAARHDPLAWAIRPHRTGTADGWLTLMDIQPQNAAIEIGNIWFSPRLQRTRAATEAIALLLSHAADDLGYRRLVWKCNALNAPSRRAAERLGFTYEGTLHAAAIAKGRRRDTAYYAILEEAWPACRAALAAWLDDANFDAAGQARHGLASLRHAAPDPTA